MPLGRFIKSSFKIRKLQEIRKQNLISVVQAELRNQENWFAFLYNSGLFFILVVLFSFSQFQTVLMSTCYQKL